MCKDSYPNHCIPPHQKDSCFHINIYNPQIVKIHSQICSAGSSDFAGISFDVKMVEADGVEPPEHEGNWFTASPATPTVYTSGY